MSKKPSNGTIAQHQMEIQEIGYILKKLKEGRIKEFTGVNSDGNLVTNVENLEKKISDLLNKIDRDLPSDIDGMDEIFKTK